MGSNGPESQLATLIAPVNDGPPLEAAHAMMVPVNDLEQLFA
jgi:hypothetical protein